MLGLYSGLFQSPQLQLGQSLDLAERYDMMKTILQNPQIKSKEKNCLFETRELKIKCESKYLELAIELLEYCESVTQIELVVGGSLLSDTKLLLKVFSKVKDFKRLSIVDQSTCPELSLLNDILGMIKIALPKLDIKYTTKSSSLIVDFIANKSQLNINLLAKTDKDKIDLLKKTLIFFPQTRRVLISSVPWEINKVLTLIAAQFKYLHRLKVAVDNSIRQETNTYDKQLKKLEDPRSESSLSTFNIVDFSLVKTVNLKNLELTYSSSRPSSSDPAFWLSLESQVNQPTWKIIEAHNFNYDSISQRMMLCTESKDMAKRIISFFQRCWTVKHIDFKSDLATSNIEILGRMLLLPCLERVEFLKLSDLFTLNVDYRKKIAVQNQFTSSLTQAKRYRIQMTIFYKYIAEYIPLYPPMVICDLII